MITFACPACLTKLTVKEELAGKKGKCPGCGQAVEVPRRAAASDAPDAPPTGATTSGEGKLAETVTHQPPSRPDFHSRETAPGGAAVPRLTDGLAPPQSDDELGRLGKYRILKVLGRGGMGVVYKAEDPKLRRTVAIKAILPALAASESAGKRFMQEAQAMAAVKHDHVATIYQVDEEGGVPFLAMEFLVGETLEERLKRDRTLPPADVLRIGREMAEGLGAAHATGLIHRDIKPANVWLEAPRSRVKILDFGLARAVSADSGLTQHGAIMGTPAYMAPEQGRGEVVDARCDLFSLGVVLYRLCTGEQPFKGKDVMSVLTAVALVQPPPPVRLNADVPQELSDLVMKLLEKEPTRRPASAAEVAEALLAVNGASDKKPGRKQTSRRPLAPWLVGLGLLCLAPLAWWLVAGRRVEAPSGRLVVRVDGDAEERLKGGQLLLTGPDGEVRHVLAQGEREKTIEAGPYGVRVEGADGLAAEPRQINLEKDGKVTVRVTAAAGAASKPQDPDREAAGWVLHVGGKVGLNGQEEVIGAAADLPAAKFWLTRVDLHQNKKVDDASLARLKRCKNLAGLNLWGTKVGDAGLTHLADCKGLTDVDLGDTKITNAGVGCLKDFRNLLSLTLANTQVGDDGVAHFHGCTGLTYLNLANTQVGDSGLAHFQGCKNLTGLLLAGTRVTDKGVAPFKDCKNLKFIGLQKTKVTPALFEEFVRALPKTKIWR